MPHLPRSPLRISDLATRKVTEFTLTPDADERAAVADALGIIGIKKLRFEGELRPQGKADWVLNATLGATVVQPCVVTLDPVSTRIDEEIARSYVAGLPEPTAGEAEMPEDDSVEPLPVTLDLAEVMIEALALALPQYPRADGAALGEAVFAAPGTAPMKDEDAKPFAGLAGLRESLEKKDE